MQATIYMSEYHRFHLQKYRPGSKIICPGCGHRTFTRYIDEKGRITFSDDVGRCDRDSCGWHKTPKEFFTENPSLKPRDNWNELPVTNHSVQPKTAIMFMPREVMTATMKGYDRNALFIFLADKFGRELTLEIFQLYNVGTARKWEGSTVFWQVDVYGNVRTGKVIKYGADGHRIKGTEGSKVTWAHSLWQGKPHDFTITQCYFGEHLLSRFHDKKVMIVESEKTAIIGSLLMPKFLWLASGGCHGCLKPELSKVLGGRDVILVPDLKMEAKWQEKADTLRGICDSVTLFDMSQLNPSADDIEKGLDIGDFLLRAIPGKRETMLREFEEIKRRWARDNPQFFAQFVEMSRKLELKLVAIETMDGES